jgi:hypothetical protein
MKQMEDSVADVAATHVDAQDYADKLASRLFTFIEKYAEVLLEQEGKISSETPAAIKQAAVDLKVNELLVSIFSKQRNVEYDPLKGQMVPSKTSSIVEGEKSESGNIGLNPISLRKAFKEGNLREKMYLPYKTTWDFTHPILKDPVMVAKINQKLEESDAGWKVDNEMLKEITEKQNLFPYSPGIVAAKTREDGLRANLSPEEREGLIRDRNLKVEDDASRRIPLSEREKRHATSELSPDSTKMGEELKGKYNDRAKEKIQWKPGSYWYRTQKNEELAKPHAYLTAAEKVEAPSVAGISGTTDQILTMGMFLGMSSFGEMEKGRLACLGWMLDATDHSMNEIMTASTGFGFEYIPSPTSYTQIYSQDEDFVSKLQDAQKSKDSNLPETFLSEEHVRQKAEELFHQ